MQIYHATHSRTLDRMYIYQLSANNQKYLNQMYLFAFSTIDVRWTLQYVFVLGKFYSNTSK